MVEEALGRRGIRSKPRSVGHNEQEMERLRQHGVTTITEPIQISMMSTRVIHSRGDPQVQQELEANASKVVDATCPFRHRVQRLASRAAAAERHVVVVGSPDHLR